jgi:hypothetical protein
MSLPLVRCHLVGRRTPSSESTVPLTTTGPDEVRPSSLPNQTVRFALFWAGPYGSCLFLVQTYFGDSTGKSTTSSTSTMKGRNSGTNRSDLNKNNILKPTFDTLTEEGHKAFEAYCANLEELFLSRCEVTRQGTVLRDTTPIVFMKPEVIPEIRPDPSPSCNDIQSMINSALERQAKSTDELLRRLIEEWDGKKLDSTGVIHSSSSCAVSFTQTNPHTSGTKMGNTTMPNPSAHSVNHFHSRTTIESSTPTFEMLQQTTYNMFGQGYMQTTSSFSMPNFTSTPYTPRGQRMSIRAH